MTDDFEARIEAQLLRTGEPRALAAPTPVTIVEGEATRAEIALAALKDAALAGIKRNDRPNRVVFRDGFVLEGRAADEWVGFMDLIIKVADNALSPTPAPRAGE